MTNYRNMSDAEIVSLAKSGDASAQDFIMDKYKSLVKKTARTFFIMGADYEDIVQEGMLGLFKAVRDYASDRGVNFSAYANICITRQIINAIKTASRKKHSPLNNYIPLDNEPLINLVEKSPEETLIIKEEHQKMIDGIYSLLSSFETKILDLYLDGKSYQEIGNELLKNEKSVDNAIQRIRKKLKNN